MVGAYQFDKDGSVLDDLTRSKKIWGRRIAMMATFYHSKRREFDRPLQVAQLLFYDNEDLIHKALSCMPREIGKRDLVVEESYLQTCYHEMPRAMLRYAIEKVCRINRLSYFHAMV